MKTILVIDDDAEIYKCIRELLERDYKVFTALSGKDGLNVLQKEKISLAILDYMLPDIDGLEVLKEIRKSYKIPVIMITAHGNKEVVLKSWRYQADYYFDKPFKLRDLKEKVQELLKSPQAAFPFDLLRLNPSELSPDIRRSLEFIGSNFSSSKRIFRKMTLQEVSAITTVTPKHLSRLFKKECNYSMNQIITFLKIEKAKKLLNNKDKEIKEIAYELG